MSYVKSWKMCGLINAEIPKPFALKQTSRCARMESIVTGQWVTVSMSVAQHSLPCKLFQEFETCKREIDPVFVGRWCLWRSTSLLLFLSLRQKHRKKTANMQQTRIDVWFFKIISCKRCLLWAGFVALTSCSTDACVHVWHALKRFWDARSSFLNRSTSFSASHVDS